MARKKAAGAFDIRNIIGILIGIYGVILLLAGAFMNPGVNPDTGVQKSSGDNIWVGIVLVVVAICFAVWTKLDPILLPEDNPETAAPSRVK